MTPTELARRTGTAERYIREWLAAQAAAGYVRYDAAADGYSLSEEQALVFADGDRISPDSLPDAVRGRSSTGTTTRGIFCGATPSAFRKRPSSSASTEPITNAAGSSPSRGCGAATTATSETSG